MKKFYFILTGLFIIFFTKYNFHELTLNNDALNPYFKYFSNTNIRTIYFISILLNLILILLIILSLLENKIPKIRNKLLLINVIVPIFLIILFLVEYYYGSTFYYGEVRDKQGFPFSGINFGIFGIIVLLGFSILNFSVYNLNKKK